MNLRNHLEVASAIILAVLLSAAFSRVSPSLLLVFNFFSWIVVYFALIKGEVYGALTGTVCGLLQDSFSLGVFGLAGLTKTLLGFVTGFVSKKINVIPADRNFIFLFILVSLELVLWKLLASFILSERLGSGGILILFQPAVTALAATIAFQIRRRVEKAGD